MLGFRVNKQANLLMVELEPGQVIICRPEDVKESKWISISVGAKPDVTWVVTIGNNTYTGRYATTSEDVLAVCNIVTSFKMVALAMRDNEPYFYCTDATNALKERPWTSHKKSRLSVISE